jgi:SH3 domain-containing YSC84-like protein 1
MRRAQTLLLVTIAAVFTAAGADDTTARLGKATAVLNTMMQSGREIRAGELARADCVVVIPGFKKGAIVVGVGHGRGFISCRNGGNWSAPGAITLDSSSLGVQLGGEEMNMVILSTDKDLRSKLLSDRFAIGSDAIANGHLVGERGGAVTGRNAIQWQVLRCHRGAAPKNHHLKENNL